MKNRKTMIILAHLDDETFGLGGFMNRFNPYNVRILIMCNGRNEENHKTRIINFKKNMAKYGYGFKFDVLDYKDLTLQKYLITELTDKIDYFVDEFKPNIIITNSEDDIHQDHTIVSKAVKISCRPTRRDFIEEIYELKIPGSEPFTSKYYDTEIFLTDFEYALKKELCENYITEKIPEISKYEYLKTIYRKLSI